MKRTYIVLSVMLIYVLSAFVATSLTFSIFYLLVPKCGMSCLGWGFLAIMASPLNGLAIAFPVTLLFYKRIWKTRKSKRY